MNNYSPEYVRPNQKFLEERRLKTLEQIAPLEQMERPHLQLHFKKVPCDSDSDGSMREGQESEIEYQHHQNMPARRGLPFAIPIDSQPSSTAVPLMYSEHEINSSRQTFRTNMEQGVVKKQFNEANLSPCHQRWSSTKPANVDSFREPGNTTKKQAFSNITYSPQHNRQRVQDQSNGKVSLAQFDLCSPKELLKSSPRQQITGYQTVANSKQTLDFKLQDLGESSPSQSAGSPKSKGNSPNRDRKRKQKNKENNGHRVMSSYHSQGVGAAGLEKMDSLSPSKFERFIDLKQSDLKNPFLRKKNTEQVSVDEKRNVPQKEGFSHFTQSSIYHQRAQLADRMRFGLVKEEPAPVAESYHTQASGFSLTVKSIAPTEDGLHEEANTKPESSPDNIVKRLIRRTHKSKERHRETFCRHLAVKIKNPESIQYGGSAIKEKELAAYKQEPTETDMQTIVTTEESLQPRQNQRLETDENFIEMLDNLQVITEESQTRLVTEDSLAPRGDRAGDRMRRSFSKPPFVNTNEQEDEHHRSLTITELEMQVRVIEQQDNEVKAQLDQIVVPDVPKAMDLASGSSLNTDKMYEKYNKILSGGNSVDSEINRQPPRKELNTADCCRDSLEGSPSQKEFAANEHYVQNHLASAEEVAAAKYAQTVNPANGMLGSKSSCDVAQLLTEESPTQNVHHFGSASNPLDSKYSAGKKKEHVQSCHVDEQNYYISEIDKLKNELDTLRNVEYDIMQNNHSNTLINGAMAAAEARENGSLLEESLLDATEIVLDDPKNLNSKDGGSTPKIVPHLTQSTSLQNINHGYYFEMGNLGAGLFHSQEELQIANENDEDQEELLSSSSDAPPILRLQPSPITEMDNEVDSPAAIEDQKIGMDRLNLFDRNNQMSTISEKAGESPPSKRYSTANQGVVLDLKSLMNPIRVVDNGNQILLVEPNEESQVSNNSLIQLSPACPIMNHHHDNIDDHEPFALRIIPVTLDDEAAALEPVHNVTPSETQSALWRDRFHETIEDLELQSPNSFVLNLEPIANESAEKKKKSPKRSPKKSPKKSERKTRASLAKTALAPSLSPAKSPSSPQILNQQDLLRSSNQFNLTLTQVEVANNSFADDRSASSGHNPQGKSQGAKRERRSRKSRSGSTTATKLNQMIKNIKVPLPTTANETEPEIGQIDVHVDSVEQAQPFALTSQDQDLDQEEEEVLEDAQIKSPESRDMFDQRFEMTEDCVSQKSNFQTFAVQQYKEDNKCSQVSLRVARQSHTALGQNAKSMISSPTNKSEFLLNPQIMESRNIINVNKSNNVEPSSQPYRMMVENQSQGRMNIRLPDQFSQHSSTSRSSMFNTAVLKQQIEPAEDDNQMQQKHLPLQLQPDTESVEKQEFDLQYNGNMKSDPFRQEMTMMDDRMLDRETEWMDERDPISNDANTTVRKATILHAESLLSQYVGGSSVGDKNAQTNAMAHSIRNKRKMDSMFALGKALSSRAHNQQCNTVTKAERNIHNRHDISPKPVAVNAKINQMTVTPQQLSDVSGKDQAQHTHQRSFYCEEFNMTSARQNLQDSFRGPKSHAVNSSAYQSSQQASKASVDNVKATPFSHQPKLDARRSVGAESQYDRRYKMNDTSGLKVITDVSEMQRVTATVKQKMLNKYATRSSQVGLNNTQNLNVSTQDPFQKRAEKSYNDNDEDEVDIIHGSCINGLMQKTFDGSEQSSKKYFNGPEDLRSRSNSNIGCGLYRNKKLNNAHRASMSLNATNSQVVPTQKQGRNTMAATQNISPLQTQDKVNSGPDSATMRTSTSATHLSKNRRSMGAVNQSQVIKGYGVATQPRLAPMAQPTYARATNSFAQKKSVAVPSMSYKSMKSPMRNQNLQQVVLCSEQKQMLDQLTALVKEDQAASQAGSKWQPHACKSKSQSAVSCPSKRHNYKSNMSATQTQVLQKVETDKGPKFNMVRRNHIIQNTRDSPKKSPSKGPQPTAQDQLRSSQRLLLGTNYRRERAHNFQPASQGPKQA